MKRGMTFILSLLLFGCSGSSEKTSPAAAQGPAPDDQAAVKYLHDVNAAQADYQHRTRRFALSFDELHDAHLLDQDPSKAATGYEISLHPSADAESYILVATPSSATPNVKYFYTDKTGIIRVEQGKEATASSPPIS